MPMLTAESFAAAKTVKITDLVADATVSQSTIQTDLEKLGYHYVKLSWTGGSAATKYVIYSSTRSGSGYTKLATTKTTSQNLLLKKGITYLKVRAYIKTTAQTLSTWVSINPGDINSTDITFTSKASSMTVGDKMTFKGKANGFVSSAVRWKTSDSKIATVSSSGIVTAVKAGTVNIIAIAHNGITKSTSLEVIDVYPATVTITGASVRNMINGSTLKLTATPSKAKYIGITWSSSKPSVATVSSKGLVTALSNGTTTITATAQGGAKDTVKVTVTPSVENMVKWAMILVGMQLGNSKLKKILKNYKLLISSLINVTVIPFLTFLAVNWLPLTNPAKVILIFAAAFPCAVITVAIASKENKNAGLMAEGVALSTLFSMATLPITSIILMSLYM